MFRPRRQTENNSSNSRPSESSNGPAKSSPVSLSAVTLRKTSKIVGPTSPTRWRFHQHFTNSFLCTKVFWENFMSLRFGMVIVWWKEIGKKADQKMFVILTTGNHRHNQNRRHLSSNYRHFYRQTCYHRRTTRRQSLSSTTAKIKIEPWEYCICEDSKVRQVKIGWVFELWWSQCRSLHFTVELLLVQATNY